MTNPQPTKRRSAAAIGREIKEIQERYYALNEGFDGYQKDRPELPELLDLNRMYEFEDQMHRMASAMESLYQDELCEVLNPRTWQWNAAYTASLHWRDAADRFAKTRKWTCEAIEHAAKDLGYEPRS